MPHETRYKSEAQVAKDALEIFEGACNPIAISGALREMILFYSNDGGHPACKNRAPIRMVLEQLAFLLGFSMAGTNGDYITDTQTIANGVGPWIGAKGDKS